MLGDPTGDALADAEVEPIDEVGVRVARGAQDELVILQRVDETGVAGNNGSDKSDHAVKHNVQRIGGGNAARYLVKELEGVEGIAEASHGGGGLRHAADTGACWCDR